MASIIKRKKNYSIVYTYVDENGETKQKWETRTSYQEALKRKAEIESQKSSHSFLPPTNQNIAEFLSGLRLPLWRKAVGRVHVRQPKLADRQLHQPHHRGYEGAGHHARG